jgi:hypothetical protein
VPIRYKFNNWCRVYTILRHTSDGSDPYWRNRQWCHGESNCIHFTSAVRHGKERHAQASAVLPSVTCDIVRRNCVRFDTGFTVILDVLKYRRIKKLIDCKVNYLLNYLRSRVRIRNLTVRGVRVSQWCGWGLKSSGMSRCVVRRVVPDNGLFLDCYPWRWRHHDLSKRRKPLTQRNRVTSQESWILKQQSLSYWRFPPQIS